MSLACVQKQGFTVYYRPGTADEAVLEESFDKDIFFSGVPEYTPAADHIIMDIGAHIGCFALLAAKHAQQGMVFAFEPAATTFAVLQQNAGANHCNNIRLFNQAVGATDGHAVLFHDLENGNWGHTISKAISTETEQVSSITLQTFMLQQSLSRINFIKFNCEGAEFAILLQTPVEILQRIDTMLILYHMDLVEDLHYRQLVQKLSAAGFRVHMRHQEKRPPRGWIIAYRAGFMQHIFIEIKSLPAALRDVFTIMRRKIRSARYKLFHR
jgi:FkbM family methyltransferase